MTKVYSEIFTAGYPYRPIRISKTCYTFTTLSKDISINLEELRQHLIADARTTTEEYTRRRLHEFATDECIVLSALNAPELDTGFIQTLFRENAPDFHYVRRLQNLESFPTNDEEWSLKNLIFKRDAYAGLPSGSVG